MFQVFLEGKSPGDPDQKLPHSICLKFPGPSDSTVFEVRPILGTLVFASTSHDSDATAIAELCLSQFQLDTSPRGNPQEKFFERANLGHPGIFLSNSLPQGKKMMVQFPGVGQNFSKLEETVAKGWALL